MHTVFTPPAGTIGTNERVVLKSFFGIEAAEVGEMHADLDPDVDWNMAPEPVVPLAEVEEICADDLEETPTIEAERLEAPVIEAHVIMEPSAPVFRLTGTFASTAANSSGRSAATKQQ